MLKKNKNKPSSSKPKSDRPRLVLPGPDDLNIPPQNLSDYRILIYGRKGVGKSTLASKFDNAMVAMLERFRRGLSIRMYPNDKVMEEIPDFTWTWEDLEDFTDQCLSDDSVGTLVYDTLDQMYAVSMAYVCKRRNISHPSEMKNDFGATWGAIKENILDLLLKVSVSKKGMVCTSHCKELEIVPASGEPYTQLVPSLSEGAFKMVQETFDFVFHYGYHGMKRAISVRPLSESNTEVFCSVGPEDTFMDPEGEPLSLFTVPNSPSGAYETLLAAFDNKVWDAVRGKPKPKGKK